VPQTKKFTSNAKHWPLTEHQTEGYSNVSTIIIKKTLTNSMHLKPGKFHCVTAYVNIHSTVGYKVLKNEL